MRDLEARGEEICFLPGNKRAGEPGCMAGPLSSPAEALDFFTLSSLLSFSFASFLFPFPFCPLLSTILPLLRSDQWHCRKSFLSGQLLEGRGCWSPSQVEAGPSKDNGLRKSAQFICWIFSQISSASSCSGRSANMFQVCFQTESSLVPHTSLSTFMDSVHVGRRAGLWPATTGEHNYIQTSFLFPLTKK